jgi:two-component system sensor histidine kinase QseC
MISIRRQLTRELLGAVLVLLVGGLGALYFAARDAATDQFDVALQAKARAISTLTSFEDNRARVAFNDRFMPGFEDRKPRDFFQLWDAQGREIARSESLGQTWQLPRRVGTLERPTEWNFTLPSGRPARAVGFSFHARAPQLRGRDAGPELHLVVASDREDLDETLWQLLALCAGIAVLLIAVTLWLLPRVLRRGLVPVNELGVQASRIDATSLSTRFDAERFPIELRPIAERLNDLLGRLEQSFERERRFSADLAHELRTPLAELRSLAECALKWPESRDPEHDRDTLAISQHMERLVTHILALARGEQGQLPVQIESLALHEQVAAIWATFAPRAAERELVVVLGDGSCVAEADRGLLRSILTNLFENAVDYTPSGGAVRIAVATHRNGIALTVANSVTGLRPDEVAQMFDRFWRKETARSGGQHLGLGLALSRAFAVAMGWTLSARLVGEAELEFVLHGPGQIAAVAPEVATTHSV